LGHGLLPYCLPQPRISRVLLLIAKPSFLFFFTTVPLAGTGKTATFAIGILQRLDIEVKQCQAMVLAPTRELAQQIVKVIGALGDFMNVKIHACVGGTAVRDDIRTLQEGVHVVVGTPGRVYDMIQRRALKLDHVQLFVLDEADEMLSRGFKEQIYDVFKYMPESVQCTIFSATMPLDVSPQCYK
jgi:translation initiation factor 4A